MNILDHPLVKALPALYTQDGVDDPIVTVRIFHPSSDWFWYPLEVDLDKGLFFGLVRGFEAELGSFSTAEFQSVEESTYLPFQVDETFKPMKLTEVKRLPNRHMPDEGLTIIFIV